MRLIGVMQVAVVLGSIHAALAAVPTGEWERDDGTVRVRIEACGADICATNTWVKDPASAEKVGDVLVMSLKPIDPATLKGTAFDRRRNATYSFEMKVEADRLITKGCVLGGLLCKNVAWRRV